MNGHLLGVAKVRRSLMVPIIAFTVINATIRVRDPRLIGITLAYVLFDIVLWTGVAFLIFAVIERRQRMPPQPRIAAMVAATAGVTMLVITMITVRALFESIANQRSFVSMLLRYLPARFYAVTFYVAIVTGIGYAVHSWAVDERREAAEAELDAAIARAELKAAAGRLQPELLDPALARLMSLMATNPAAAQQLISDLGAMLHDALANPECSAIGSERRDRALTLQ